MFSLGLKVAWGNVKGLGYLAEFFPNILNSVFKGLQRKDPEFLKVSKALNPVEPVCIQMYAYKTSKPTAWDSEINWR